MENAVEHFSKQQLNVSYSVMPRIYMVIDIYPLKHLIT